MILIDYNGIAISNIVTQKLAIEENMIRHMILNSIRSHVAKHKFKYGTNVVIAGDGQRNWRYEAFPQYKAKRQTDRKESKIDWQDVFRITNMVFDELRDYFPYRVIKVDQCEADDIIGLLAYNTQEFGQHEDIMIISGDKDFGQLQKFSNIAQYSPVQRKFIKIDNPRKQLMELILKGDTSDGVPNVLSPDNAFVDGIRQTPLRQPVIDKLTDDPKALGEEVYRNFLRNKKLIDLMETPDSLKQEIINKFHEDPIGKKSDVLPYLISKKCRQLVECVGDFV
jgi:hypothetical protein